ncbi:hypothetical protein HYPSUDRAFT_198478 [Hypholoma sublateritium FD-334 SS-4]|uniref:Fungal-type protein kinase domain-containing protein n=1 Tax=Hypholoma sublateritium (strain FD-334 SS-4) TaxID=945553 RepID=A0A0D2P8B0_HYPSF|nr:hypothetical protein HYPSUDRAFT_198478 [Hypholoma sublateritium FD-334 SS-4]
MPRSRSLPITTSNIPEYSHSTSSSHSDSSGFYSVQPSERPHPPVISKVKQDTIFSFEWSGTDTDCESSMSVPAAQIVDPKGKNTSDLRNRHEPPTLPPPLFYSTLLHDDVFDTYIKAEGLGPEAQRPADATGTGSEDVPPVNAQAPGVEAVKSIGQTYSNMPTIEKLNASRSFVSEKTSQIWIFSLLNDSSLPKPFNLTATYNSNIWKRQQLGGLGGDVFRNIPDLTEAHTMKWLNDTSVSIGYTHGLLKHDIDNTSDPDFGWKPSDSIPFRIFNDSGHNKALSGGLNSRKPDMVLLDRDHPYRQAKLADRLDWGPVRALVEVSVQESHYQVMLKTLLDKAANIFHCQLHRNYVLGLAIFGKGNKMKYFFVLVDRGGAVATHPTEIKGFDAHLLARIIYAFAFGSNKLLGMDPSVEVDHITGAAVRVSVDKQWFTVLKAIHISPVMCSRGTRVYIVQDDKRQYHILKDSWVLLSHAKENSEIARLKLISDKSQEKLLSALAADKTYSPSKPKKMSPESIRALRSYLLRPRFVAGDENVADTDTPRHNGTWVQAFPRIRRRTVHGPIGDPITSYRSRVECLQAFIDIVDVIKFFDGDCTLLHGDISVSNIVIVRFLPQIILAAMSCNGGVEEAMEYMSIIASLRNPSASHRTPRMELESFFDAPSGGAVIDFDYSRAKGSVSTDVSGTVPYMSIELSINMTGNKVPFEHRMDHDVESLFLAFLHIVRFTPGPAGDPGEDILVTPNEIRISQWHHDTLVANIPHVKGSDILRLRDPDEMASVLPKYWRPLAPNVIRLIDIVYPQVTIPLRTGKNISELFKQELNNILAECHKLEDTPHRYGTCMPYQTRFPLRKRKAIQDNTQTTSQSESMIPVPVKAKRSKTSKR